MIENLENEIRVLKGMMQEMIMKGKLLLDRMDSGGDVEEISFELALLEEDMKDHLLLVQDFESRTKILCETQAR